MREAPIGGRPRCAWEPPEREDAITGTCAAMGHDPALMVVEHDGSLPSDAQLLIGKVGDELPWLRIAPTGRVWALTISYLEGGQVSTLYLVAEDAAPGS